MARALNLKANELFAKTVSVVGGSMGASGSGDASIEAEPGEIEPPGLSRKRRKRQT